MLKKLCSQSALFCGKRIANIKRDNGGEYNSFL